MRAETAWFSPASKNSKKNLLIPLYLNRYELSARAQMPRTDIVAAQLTEKTTGRYLFGGPTIFNPNGPTICHLSTLNLYCIAGAGLSI